MQASTELKWINTYGEPCWCEHKVTRVLTPTRIYDDIWLDDQMVGWYLASWEKPSRIDSPNLDSFSWLAPFEHMLISNWNMLKQRDCRIHQLYFFFSPGFIIHTEPPVIIIIIIYYNDFCYYIVAINIMMMMIIIIIIILLIIIIIFRYFVLIIHSSGEEIGRWFPSGRSSTMATAQSMSQDGQDTGIDATEVKPAERLEKLQEILKDVPWL